jgi:hypothetical protein
VAAEVLHVNDGDSHCRVADPTNGAVVNAPVIEISLQGVLIGTQIQFEANAYIDITLALKDLAPRQLFAHVVTCNAEGLRLRWLHFDPGEETRLKGLLDSYTRLHRGGKGPAASPGRSPVEGAQNNTRRVVKPRTSGVEEGGPILDGSVPAPGAPVSGTRRLVRPSASAITPFSDALPPETGSERVGSRRVVRPSNSGMAPVDQARAEATRDPFDDSRAHQVVIAPTERFEELRDVGTSRAENRQPAEGAAAPAAPAAESTPATTTGDPPTSPFPGDSTDKHVAGGKTAVIGRDGRMDIGASIRSHAKTVRASELAARHDRVRVLNMATIRTLIVEAVEEAATHLTRSLSEGERKRLLEEAEEGFQERLKSFEVEKASAEEKAKRLNDQLETARKLLEDERKRTIKADQFTVSAEGLGEIEDRFQRLLTRSLADGGVSPQLEDELRKLISRILDSEREKIRAKELEAQNSKIELLERKISRLAGTLEETEKQRDDAQRFASFLEQQGGGALRNVFEAGLKEGDPNKERKLALMKHILDENRALRGHLGIALADPNAPEEPKEQAPDATQSAVNKPVADTAAFRREMKADVAELKEAASHITEHTPHAPEALPDDLVESEALSRKEAGVGLEVNPDDEPWEVTPLADTGAGVNASGIKRISVPTTSAPPPMERQSKGDA